MGFFGKEKISTNEVFEDGLCVLLMDVVMNKYWDEPTEFLISNTITVDRIFPGVRIGLKANLSVP